MKKKTIVDIVLKVLTEAESATLDIFFPPFYAHTRLARKLLGVDTHPVVAKKTFASILARLQRDGLVVRRGRRGASRWAITKKGRTRAAEYDYEERLVPEKDGVSRLVVFDIPEEERKKRDMVRGELVACDFKQLQKSVWIGYGPLPKSFIAVLDVLSLKNKVHIFTVQKLGTLRDS